MDNALDTLLSSQFLLFCLGMFALTWLIRVFVEYFFPKSVGSKLWEKLLLPVMPLIFGAVIAIFAKQYPYPNNLVSFSGRIIFGSVSGMFSGLVYQVIKGVLKDKVQSMINSAPAIVNNNQVNNQVTTTVVAPAMVDPNIGSRNP